MFRRVSSLVLISLLTILVGVKDLALGFCLCEESLFLGKDPCSAVLDDHSRCTTCCSEKEEPCDDCVVPVQLEVEDYLWANDSHLFQAPPLSEPEVTPSTRERFLSPPTKSYPPAFEPPPPLGRDLLIRQRRLLL